MKRIVKILSVLFAFTLLGVSVSSTYVNAASNIYFAGEYKNTKKKVKYKLCLNEYSSREGKKVGNYEFKALTKGYVGWDGELKRIGKNTYIEKCSGVGGYTLLFKVYKKKVVVKQMGTVLRGVNFTGTYKKSQTYPRP